MTRSTFSTTTIASSTNRPMASTMPNIVSVLMEKPATERIPKVPQQYDRYRDRGYQRRAEVLQEHVHDDEYEHDRPRTVS